MVTIAIQLPDEQAARLAELAARFHLSPEQLAAAQVLDLLSRPDDRFEQAARFVLEKNAELYRRLA
jgi:antitoxin FitA